MEALPSIVGHSVDGKYTLCVAECLILCTALVTNVHKFIQNPINFTQIGPADPLPVCMRLKPLLWLRFNPICLNTCIIVVLLLYYYYYT